MQRRTKADAGCDTAAHQRQLTKQVLVPGVPLWSAAQRLTEEQVYLCPLVVPPCFEDVMGGKVAQQRKEQQQPCPVPPAVLLLPGLVQASLLPYELV